MDSKLYNGDHAVDKRGFPVSVSGAEELLQRALIRLTVPKGSFARDQSLGSELYRLRGSGQPASLAAAAYVQEALAGMSGLTVETVTCGQSEGGVLLLEILLGLEGESHTLRMEVAG